jgi:hypothetical protein
MSYYIILYHISYRIVSYHISYSQFYLQGLTKELDSAVAPEMFVNYTSEFWELYEVTTNMECRILTSVLEMEVVYYW